MSRITIAVAGNPNAGKTTLFNTITGSRQIVGNYPGVTVEKIEGMREVDGTPLCFVDLPGTYSMTAYSQEEIVARNFIVDNHPDVVLNVVDASNLERNLYLTLQLAEMGVPMVVALNMYDIARQRGIVIDVAALSTLLGVPVITTIGHRNEGTEELVHALLAVAQAKQRNSACRVMYSPVTEEEIARLVIAIQSDTGVGHRHDDRWLAIKLLEQDERAIFRVRREAAEPTPLLDIALKGSQRILHDAGEDASTQIAEHRYGHAAGIMQQSAVCDKDSQTISDAIDMIACNRWLGLFIVAAVVALTFKLTFFFSDGWAFIPWDGEWLTPVGFLGWVFDSWLPSLVEGIPPGMFRSLLSEGIIAGVGGVVGFVPFIFVMFFFLGMIEDSGYIARIAFVMDRIMRSFGLQGKSIMALIVSGGIAGGCAVPGVMATRTLREEKDRLTTMLVAPFMNCGAKMPVFGILIAAFFARHRWEMFLLISALSWLFALLAAFFLRTWIIRGTQTPFVMELPPYHRPTFRAAFRSASSRGWMYLKKAGTIILAINILIWILMNFPAIHTEGMSPQEARSAQLEHSVAGRVGRFLEPISRAAGFDWRDNIALIGGFAAKEVIISTLATTYRMESGDTNTEDDGLVATLQTTPGWNPVRALAFLLFVMLYAPCIVTVVTIGRESGSWRWALFSVVYSTTIAYVMAVAVFQIGSWISATVYG